MFIYNNSLSEYEKEWLESLLSINFINREGIIYQINHSQVEREYTKYYLFLKFQCGDYVRAVNIKERVPVEMRVYKDGEAPLLFLLHIINGFVAELEIFYADSSEISEDLVITNDRRDVIVNELLEL